MSFFLNTTVCGFSLYHILAFFLIYSCLGWCVEVVYAAATTGQLVNRGFLNGPVCPIYGFGMILVLFFLTPLEDDLLLLYLGGVILPSALELVGGWALYKLYRTRWWDYTDKPFNIGGYVCLEFSLMWGVGAMVMVKVIHPTLAALVNIIPPLVGFVLMCLLYAVYAADVVATAIAASDLARELDALEKVADSMHAVSDAMTEILGTTALDMDQKMDESRLQLKLAAAEARDSYDKLSPREAASTMRTRADEAMEAARRASQTARLNAAEAAKAVADHCGERILYINVMNNLSVDCGAHPAAPEMGDIGILASTDPVALDKACVDLVYASDDPGKVHLIERIESRHGTHTLDHAAAIGLGDPDYELIDIDN